MTDKKCCRKLKDVKSLIKAGCMQNCADHLIPYKTIYTCKYKNVRKKRIIIKLIANVINGCRMI